MEVEQMDAWEGDCKEMARQILSRLDQLEQEKRSRCTRRACSVLHLIEEGPLHTIGHYAVLELIADCRGAWALAL